MSASPPDLPGVEHSRVRAGDVTLHVATAGPADAPPVVLLHGWPQHFACWRKVIPLLATDRRVIAPDLRGLGWSDAPPGAYAKSTLAADVLALLDALGLQRVDLIGHDWGGYAGFLLATDHPERISSYLALCIPHPWAQVTPTPKVLASIAYQFVLAPPVLGAATLRFTPFLDLVFRASSPPGLFGPEEQELYRERFRDPARAAAASALYRTFLLRERTEIARRYAQRRLTVPTRLLVGRRDAVVTPDRVRGWEGHADDMAVEVVDTTHWLPEEDPGLVADRARALWASASAA